MEKTILFTVDEVSKCFQYAKNMKGKHHAHFTGDEVIEKRNDKEIFVNDLQGKLAEIAVRKYVKERYGDRAVIHNDIEFDIWNIGRWDKGDLKINKTNINIKSVKNRSVALMIETHRFNEDGTYTYNNNDGSKTQIDCYILVGIEFSTQLTWLDFKSDFEYFLNPYINNDKTSRAERIVRANILGMIRHKEFWAMKKYIPRGTVATVRNLNAFLLKDVELRNLPDTDGSPLVANNYAVHKNCLKSF